MLLSHFWNFICLCETRVNDEARELTLKGIEESKLMANWLAQQNPVFERVFTSPYVRAVQTYQAMQPLLPYSGGQEVLSELILMVIRNLLLIICDYLLKEV